MNFIFGSVLQFDFGICLNKYKRSKSSALIFKFYDIQKMKLIDLAIKALTYDWGGY